MKKIIFSMAFAAMAFTSGAQVVPAPSPLAEISQMVGLTEIELEYSRPALNGRTILTEKFVPAEELWRTGANSASKISFSEDVKISGTVVPAGTYGIFTVPGKERVEFILNSNSSQGGTGSYDMALDVLRIKVKMEETRNMLERMRFGIENFDDSMAELVWEWGNYKFTVPIELSTTSIAKRKIDEKLKEMDGQYSFYNEAARYYIDGDMDDAQALAWAKKSVEMSEKFWNVHTLARAYHASGDMKNATKYAQQSLELSKAADYGPYIVMNEELLAKIKSVK